ncbi:hypothetical protein LTR78_010873 [Recurvomyces mirabilis]|uniref:Uncharacterized protein n=1 Tax=Recurvomyces mirabilis TaxID=574656 RepID=A0AAE0TLW6_9PEZI|nr:hypothetical protein LTR78_010873 [Recurvomyces mirabilis]KAK5149891.1 hypothetical protein LTS14_010606 [Recurvomyces mirabilis]
MGIGQSPVLARSRPLEFIASGGCLENRPASQDLDYFLHPTAFGQRLETVRQELSRIITATARRLRYVPDWANDNVRYFLALLNDPSDLFERSKLQNVVLYRDHHLIIYAVLWEWVLIRKLKRLQMEGQPQRREDWNDCVSICKRLNRQRPGILQLSMLRQFDHTGREPPVLETTIESLGRLLQHFMGSNPFQTASSLLPQSDPSGNVNDKSEEEDDDDDDDEEEEEGETQTAGNDGGEGNEDEDEDIVHDQRLQSTISAMHRLLLNGHSAPQVPGTTVQMLVSRGVAQSDAISLVRRAVQRM